MSIALEVINILPKQFWQVLWIGSALTGGLMVFAAIMKIQEAKRKKELYERGMK